MSTRKFKKGKDRKFVGAFIDATLAGKIKDIAVRDANGNKSIILEKILRTGVRHHEDSAGHPNGKKKANSLAKQYGMSDEDMASLDLRFGPSGAAVFMDLVDKLVRNTIERINAKPA